MTVVPAEMLYTKGYVPQLWVTCGSEVLPWNLAQLPLQGDKMQRFLSVSLRDRIASERFLVLAHQVPGECHPSSCLLLLSPDLPVIVPTWNRSLKLLRPRKSSYKFQDSQKGS